MYICTRWFQPSCYKRPPLHAWVSIPGLLLHGSIHSISISLLIWLITSKRLHHTRKYVYSRLYTCVFVSILCVCPYGSLPVSVCPGLCVCVHVSPSPKLCRKITLTMNNKVQTDGSKYRNQLWWASQQGCDDGYQEILIIHAMMLRIPTMLTIFMITLLIYLHWKV